MNKETLIYTRNVTASLPVTLYRRLLKIKEEADLRGKRISLKQIIVDALTKYCEENKDLS